MKKLGWRRSGRSCAPGHQDCVICHPETKSNRAFARRQALREIEDNMPTYRNPKPTVDAVIFMEADRWNNHEHDQIVLIERKNRPFGWALPGGFVNEGESYEAAVIREAKEETGLDVEILEQFHTYSNPDRDPRQHNASTVFLVRPVSYEQTPAAADDAKKLVVVSLRDAIINHPLAFDHDEILRNVMEYLKTGKRPGMKWQGP